MFQSPRMQQGWFVTLLTQEPRKSCANSSAKKNYGSRKVNSFFQLAEPKLAQIKAFSKRRLPTCHSDMCHEDLLEPLALAFRSVFTFTLGDGCGGDGWSLSLSASLCRFFSIDLICWRNGLGRKSGIGTEMICWIPLGNLASIIPHHGLTLQISHFLNIWTVHVCVRVWLWAVYMAVWW